MVYHNSQLFTSILPTILTHLCMFFSNICPIQSCDLYTLFIISIIAFKIFALLLLHQTLSIGLFSCFMCLVFIRQCNGLICLSGLHNIRYNSAKCTASGFLFFKNVTFEGEFLESFLFLILRFVSAYFRITLLVRWQSSSLLYGRLVEMIGMSFTDQSPASALWCR